jgi:hypothetical protein
MEATARKSPRNASTALVERLLVMPLPMQSRVGANVIEHSCDRVKMLDLREVEIDMKLLLEKGKQRYASEGIPLRNRLPRCREEFLAGVIGE